jgi:hypothetical protein
MCFPIRRCQLYVWAVETTQFVASIRVDADTKGCVSSTPSSSSTASPDSSSNVDSLLAGLESYLQQHPPVSPEVLDAALEECRRFKCEHLIEKLQAATANCSSAVELVTARQVAYLARLLKVSSLKQLSVKRV